MDEILRFLSNDKKNRLFTLNAHDTTTQETKQATINIYTRNIHSNRSEMKSTDKTRNEYGE